MNESSVERLERLYPASAYALKQMGPWHPERLEMIAEAICAMNRSIVEAQPRTEAAGTSP